MKHYTYKVTFPGFPWFYFGVHTDNGKPYFGSPKTHKWLWGFYECEVQILEWFESRKEAEEVEDRLIKHFIKDLNCLNEHWGQYWTGKFSGRGAESQPKSVRSENGVKVQKRKTKGERTVAGKKAARTRLITQGSALNPGMVTEESITKGGKISGSLSLENKTGLFSEGVVTKETCSKGGRVGSSITNLTRFRCITTGYESTPGGLTAYQKSRGIDTSLRVKVEQELY